MVLMLSHLAYTCTYTYFLLCQLVATSSSLGMGTLMHGTLLLKWGFYVLDTIVPSRARKALKKSKMVGAY